MCSFFWVSMDICLPVLLVFREINFGFIDSIVGFVVHSSLLFF